MTQYKIVGGRKIGGNAPGETIQIDDKEHAEYLIAAGHIEPANKTKTQKPAAPVAEETEK